MIPTAKESFKKAMKASIAMDEAEATKSIKEARKRGDLYATISFHYQNLEHMRNIMEKKGYDVDSIHSEYFNVGFEK